MTGVSLIISSTTYARIHWNAVKIYKVTRSLIMTVFRRRKISLALMTRLTRDEFIAFIIIYFTIQHRAPASFRQHTARYVDRRGLLPYALFPQLSPLTSELVIDINAILIGRKWSLPRVKLRAETRQPPDSAALSVYRWTRNQPKSFYDPEIYSAMFYQTFRIIRQSHKFRGPYTAVLLCHAFIIILSFSPLSLF